VRVVRRVLLFATYLKLGVCLGCPKALIFDVVADSAGDGQRRRHISSGCGSCAQSDQPKPDPLERAYRFGQAPARCVASLLEIRLQCAPVIVEVA
jgi:hypothetical protein